MDLSIYKKTLKVKYQKQPKNLFELDWSYNIRRWMRKYFPKSTASEHKQLRNEALREFGELNAKYIAIRNKEFLRLFKRPYEFNDYRVSGIARNEFSESVKNQLRALTSEMNTYRDIAYAHNLMLPTKQRSMEH